MSEKGPIGRKIDQFKEKRVNKTRVQDEDVARDMADTEAPYRDLAKVEDTVGSAAVSAMWDKYPDLKGKAVITPEEIAAKAKGIVDDQGTKDVIDKGLDSLKFAQLTRNTKSLHDENRRSKLVKEVKNTDPADLSMIVAQQVGYQLQDDAARHVQVGIKAAEQVQAQAVKQQDALADTI